MAKNRRVGALRLPVGRLHIELTNRCNFSCEFCPDSRMARRRGSMDFDVLTRALDEVSDKKIASTVFFHVMGEPLLYPRLVEGLSYASSRGLNTCVTTNGSLLSGEMLSEMAEAGVSKVILSLQTPDEATFGHRGARGISFAEYSGKVIEAARRAMTDGRLDLRISFLSSPLRRLIFPVMPEVSIADDTKSLKRHLSDWADKILTGTEHEPLLKGFRSRLRWVSSFKNNSVRLGPNVSFDTRIMGDWAVHSIDDGIRARFGYCPAIQENLGILWNGDVVFCCVDYEGKTAVGNLKDNTLEECLARGQIQKALKGFNTLRVTHPHCQRCIGDKNLLNTVVRQVGSIIYFKGVRKLFPGTVA